MDGHLLRGTGGGESREAIEPPQNIFRELILLSYKHNTPVLHL